MCDGSVEQESEDWRAGVTRFTSRKLGRKQEDDGDRKTRDTVDLGCSPGQQDNRTCSSCKRVGDNDDSSLAQVAILLKVTFKQCQT